jgi:hypothetical protein
MMKTLFAAILLSAIQAMAADVYTFSPLGPENVSGPGGVPTLTGWGYTLQNQSSSDWLVTSNLTAEAFLHATPQLLFDFPDLAPGATVTALYNPVPPGAETGLYQILWDQNVPAGFVNSGTFTLSAQWWSGDPLNGGTLIRTAPDTSQPYSATLTPEPATIALIALPLLLSGVIGVLRSRRQSLASLN